MSEPSSPQPHSTERYVIAERPRISASAVLLLVLIIMNAVSIFAAMSYWARVQELQNEVSLLRSELKNLASQLSVLNEHMKRYRHIDELIELYIKQLVIKTYKELFPSLSEEELKKLLGETEESASSTTATKITTTVKEVPINASSSTVVIKK